MKLLLLSNSRNTGGAYLEHARQPLNAFLGGNGARIAFVPYAAVRFSAHEYETNVSRALPDHQVRSVHRERDPAGAVREADCIAVGGGNTFALLDALHGFGLIDAVRERVLAGVPYVGWSAGSNVACPTICTTNDMPIVEPPSFRSFGLLPFQINPHYLDAHPDGHMGETRAERIREFNVVRPDAPVLGLREGAWLECDEERMTLKGANGARLFSGDDEPREFGAEADLSFLLNPERR